MSDTTSAEVLQQVNEDTLKESEVIRYDAAPTFEVIRQDNGFLRVGATVGRTGVLEYRQSDGSVRRELRSPDEVFNRESLNSLAMVPVTLDHPQRTSPDFGLVRADNVKRLAVGHGGDSPIRDDSNLNLNLMITDSDAIAAIENGVRQISPGYTVQLEHAPGVFAGQPYDAVQKNIRYNHVAIVERGRAGPSVRLHLDSDAVECSNVSQTNIKDMPRMVKLNLDGVDFEASEQLAQAVSNSNAKKAEELTAIKAQLDQATARADAADAELTKTKEQNAELTSPDRLKETVAARLDLERSASKILGETKLDSMSDAEIMTQVILKSYPTLEDKLKDCEPAYLAASYDVALQNTAKKEVKPTKALGDVRADAEDTDVKLDSAAIREKYAQEQCVGWKKTLSVKAN